MADAKHTPGPWKMAGHDQRRIDGPNGNMVAKASLFANWMPIAQKRQAQITSEANARLIAAAPDLLEACRIMNDAVKAGHENIHDLIGHMMEAVTAARTAIAKAEGKS